MENAKRHNGGACLPTLCLLAALLCFPTAVLAQLGTGTINGNVQDSSGAVIPGATVSLLNPGVVGGNQETVSDERGAYQFVRLVPSPTYSVRAELAGFRPALRQNVVINADVNVRVDLTMEVGGVTDEVTVSGEAQLLDTASVQNQQVLSREVLDTLPTGNDLWSIGRIVPSVLVQAYDVGGNNSFNNQTLSAHGSGGDENKYMMDGMDVSHGSGAGQLERLLLRHLHVHRSELRHGQQHGRVGPGRGRLQHDLEDRHERFPWFLPNHGHQQLAAVRQPRARICARASSRAFLRGCLRSAPIRETASRRSSTPV